MCSMLVVTVCTVKCQEATTYDPLMMRDATVVNPSPPTQILPGDN